MAPIKKDFHWQKQVLAPACEIVECADHDPVLDFKRDPSGYYVLIRPDFISMKLEVAICDSKHVIVKVFRGRRAQDVYEGIFRHEQKYKCEWFKSKGHAAYLGKELKKAELALALGQNNYFQE
jgi:hypothetical protein